MKRPWQSRTVWVNLVLALLAFLPGFAEFTMNNPEVPVLVAAFVNLLLRFVTKTKIEVIEHGPTITQKDEFTPQHF